MIPTTRCVVKISTTKGQTLPGGGNTVIPTKTDDFDVCLWTPTENPASVRTNILELKLKWKQLKGAIA